MQTKDPESVNILTAMVENQRIMASENDRERKAIALAWLFHLVGDIHSLCTLCSCLLLSIPRATEVGMKSVCGRLRQANRWTCTDFGMG